MDRFEPGYQYDIGDSLGAAVLAEGWAVTVASDEPALVVPFSETDPFKPRGCQNADAPADVVRKPYPPDLDEPSFSC